MITVAIPCYRSARNLPLAINDITQTLSREYGDDYQIVLVNDSSPDNTLEVIRNLCAQDSHVTGINLSKNFGQASARMAALPYIKGEIVVFMDDDGQHPPEGIPCLVNKIREGYDYVCAHFANKQHKGWVRFTSFLYKKIAEAIGNKPRQIDTSPFFAWNRVVIDAMLQYKSPFPAIVPYSMYVTTRYANIDVEHRERRFGRSGYSFYKRFVLWLDNFTNFSMIPLRMASLLGVFSSFVGIILGIIIVINKWLHPEIFAGYTSTIAVIFFSSGIIMIILGLCGEYLGRIYMTISDMPQYIIKEVINAPEEPGAHLEVLSKTNR